MGYDISRKGRNVGIEILRVISMFMVILLHILNHGVNYPELTPFSGNWYFAWFIEGICYCAVNVYGMISGYVMVNSNIKIYRILMLWLEVFFYSGISTIVLCIFAPNYMSMQEIIKSFIPVLSQRFWYFTAYFAMFWFIPLLNWIVHSLEFEKFKGLIWGLLVVFGVLPWISEIFSTSAFGVAAGYSALWLSILYLIGAGVNKYGFGLFQLKKKKHSEMWFLNMAILSGMMIFFSKVLLTPVSLKILGSQNGSSQFYSYISPLVIMEALFLLCFFANIKVKKYEKMWTILGRTTFGIYLIHQTRVFGYYVWPLFENCINIQTISFIAVVLSGGILIFAGCFVIEWIRQKIFIVCGGEKMSKEIVKKMNISFYE